MCQGRSIGDKLINRVVGVYIPITRIPIKGGMTIPNIATFDHGTYEKCSKPCYLPLHWLVNEEFQLPSLKLTAKEPENGCLEYIRFLLGRLGLFSGANCQFQGG